MKKLILSVFLTLCLTGFMNKGLSQDKISYLALGDSYTIGEAVDQSMSWPYLLQNSLVEHGLAIQEPKVIATTGWTTDELLKAIENADLEGKSYGLVSLLIGVNNQYRGYKLEQYKKEFLILLEKAIGLAGNDASKVFVVSIPDYGVTPFAKDNDKDPAKIQAELIQYDEIARQIAKDHQVNFYNIRPISLKALWDSDAYIAKDGLHPSGKMYQDWVNYFAPAVYRQLKK